MINIFYIIYYYICYINYFEAVKKKRILGILKKKKYY